MRRSRLQPVCAEDGQINFFSPCQAGCKASKSFNDGEKTTICLRKLRLRPTVFNRNRKLRKSRCLVVRRGPGSPHPSLQPQPPFQSRSGYCPNDCSEQFYAMFGFMVPFPSSVAPTDCPVSFCLCGPSSAGTRPLASRFSCLWSPSLPSCRRPCLRIDLRFRLLHLGLEMWGNLKLLGLRHHVP